MMGTVENVIFLACFCYLTDITGCPSGAIDGGAGWCHVMISTTSTLFSFFSYCLLFHFLLHFL